MPLTLGPRLTPTIRDLNELRRMTGFVLHQEGIARHLAAKCECHSLELYFLRARFKFYLNVWDNLEWLEVPNKGWILGVMPKALFHCVGVAVDGRETVEDAKMKQLAASFSVMRGTSYWDVAKKGLEIYNTPFSATDIVHNMANAKLVLNSDWYKDIIEPIYQNIQRKATCGIFQVYVRKGEGLRSTKKGEIWPVLSVSKDGTVCCVSGSGSYSFTKIGEFDTVGYQELEEHARMPFYGTVSPHFGGLPITVSVVSLVK